MVVPPRDAALRQHALHALLLPAPMPSASHVPATRAPPAARAGSTWASTAKGFRPFFTAAAAFAVIILPIWLLTLAGVLAPVDYLDAVTWHAHEMIFGFATAVIAGFLLTAVGNWTNRETLVGWPLLAACTLWAGGRVAMACAGALPRGVPALVDLAFLPVLALAIARPIVAARNWRNLAVVGVLAGLWLANLAIHLDALGVVPDVRRRATTFAIDVIVLLLILVTARVLPMFTKNATHVDSVRRWPALDTAAIVAMIGLATLDAFFAPPPFIGMAAAVTALLVAARAWSWGARYTARMPLLSILHVGHAWIVVGLALRSAAAFTTLVPVSAATHALTVGAIGTLTLGMMSRVSLGHTGRPLTACSPLITASFVLLTVAALVRVVAPLVTVASYQDALVVVGVLWTATFLLFLAVYAPILWAPRVDGSAG